MGNLRHGQGLYVNSRLQKSYAGGWDRGTKHGEGAIYYSKDFKNSYDGGWLQVYIFCSTARFGRCRYVDLDITRT